MKMEIVRVVIVAVLEGAVAGKSLPTSGMTTPDADMVVMPTGAPAETTTTMQPTHAPDTHVCAEGHFFVNVIYVCWNPQAGKMDIFRFVLVLLSPIVGAGCIAFFALDIKRRHARSRVTPISIV